MNAKNLLTLSILTVSGLLLSNCMFQGYPAGQGPVGAIFQHTTMPGSGNNLSIPQTRVGESCTRRIYLYIVGFTWGDGTVRDAAENGGVSRISTVDTEQFNILTVYSQQCTVVKGDDTKVSRSNANNPGPGFSDTVIMRNGTVHRNVKTIIQGNLINIINPDGTSLTVPKTQVRTVRKGR